jgi:uncharacterized membrane protein YkvA (DUF1232 family)
MRIAFRDIKAPLLRPFRLLRALRDPRTPFLSRVLPLLALLYLLFPLDFIPDFIPLAGQVDDLTVALFLLYLALRLLPDEIYEEHMGLPSPSSE